MSTISIDQPAAFYDDDLRCYVAESPSLGITCTGKTLAEVAEDWKLQVQFVWEEYALAPDEDITADALELKKTLLKLTNGQRV
jgi:hypothetical protein